MTWIAALALSGCVVVTGDDDFAGETGGDTGDGDGDTGEGSADTGDGDGDTGDGDGDTGDGDGDTGDGDGDTGDGDGDTGDGDGDTGDGDGDGDCSGAAVGHCDAAPMSDAFMISNLSIIGDCLHVDVSYGGGCMDHTYDPCWDGSFAESNPVQAWLWIDHDAMGDPCDAVLMDTWIIDLTDIKSAWQTAYQSQSGSIILHVESDSIQYDF